MEEIQNALQLKSALDALRPIDKEQEDRIMQKFRLDWNYHSNHLEGNSLTYGETKALILFGVTAQGKPLKDTLEITGHNEAINWVLEMIRGERPLTENFIRELHSLLLQDSYKESKNEKGEIIPRKISSGRYKITPNHVQTVTGEIFYFATPEETPAKMFDLINWYNEKANEKESNPILIAAEFHYKFIRIHPFDDGNGRTARILMNFILMQFGFPPVIIKTEDKANYFAALQMADVGNIESFITYIATNLNHSLTIMIAGAKGENIEEDDDLDKEIALLEQKVKSYGEKISFKKNQRDIKDLITHDIGKIIKIIKEKSIKLSRMYMEFEVEAFFCKIEKNDVTGKNYISETQKFNLYDTLIMSPNRIDSIIINFRYYTFNQIKFHGFNYDSEIKFNFHELKYDVLLNDLKVFENFYGRIFTDIQINKIVKSEVKRHKEFIEQKIAEKENK